MENAFMKSKEIEKKQAKPADGAIVSIYIMGKEYKVPASLTILKATEYAGYTYTRGCGCRGGICGACATVYRTSDSYRIKVGLACQTVIEPGMHLTQIPFYPANKAMYDIAKMKPVAADVLRMYPEIARCLCCDTCTRACPQDLEVMYYIQAALRGDVKEAAKLSFECIMCGLCVSRCPAELMHYNVAILCRRLYGKYGLKKSEHLAKRVQEITDGKFKDELDSLVKMDNAQLKKTYEDRVIEEE
jgi:formate hydrogenlyase subunit 6/NADH:ubiquinone oxidoreductase subunit I